MQYITVLLNTSFHSDEASISHYIDDFELFINDYNQETGNILFMSDIKKNSKK